MEQLALFIQNNDPGIKGFNSRNLCRMKQFHEVYGTDAKLSTLWSVLPWSHNRRIMSLKTAEEREFYLNICSSKSYSFRELERLIKSGTFERTMLADEKMTTALAELPQSTGGVFKDSYIFEFLDLPLPYQEKDDEVVKYALNRSASSAVIADFETQIIPKELLRKKLNEFYDLLESSK